MSESCKDTHEVKAVFHFFAVKIAQVAQVNLFNRAGQLRQSGQQ